MQGKFVIAGFESFIGLMFFLFVFGVLIPYSRTHEGFEAFVIVVFFVCIASFAGIPVIIKKVAKGIKLLIIISVIQIGTITYSTIYTSISLFPVDMALATVVLLWLVWSFRRPTLNLFYLICFFMCLIFSCIFLIQLRLFVVPLAGVLHKGSEIGLTVITQFLPISSVYHLQSF